jgi:hypothetical protein
MIREMGSGGSMSVPNCAALPHVRFFEQQSKQQFGAAKSRRDPTFIARPQF